MDHCQRVKDIVSIQRRWLSNLEVQYILMMMGNYRGVKKPNNMGENMYKQAVVMACLSIVVITALAEGDAGAFVLEPVELEPVVGE